MEDLIEHLTPESFYQLSLWAKLLLGVLAWVVFWLVTCRPLNKLKK